MAEVKNTFIKSKMNKDLDDRLIPNGEYRNAVNVNVSRSEGPDVGAVENVLGNIKIEDFGLDGDCGLEIIGTYMDVSNDLIFVFITDYTDTSNDKLSNFSPYHAKHYLYRYNLKIDEPLLLIGGDKGRYLNFSKTHPIDNVNLIEDLLFWTDNRNQPRKINIQREEGYYLNEDQISVAKYNPYAALELVTERVIGSNLFNSGTGYQSCTTFPENCNLSPLQTIGITGTGLTISIDSVGNPSGQFPPTGPVLSYTIQNYGNGYSNGDVLSFEGKQGGNGFQIQLQTVLEGTMKNRTEEVYVNPEDPTNVENQNPYYDPNWEGDPDFLQDKFVRFSYRFKFDDGEYSLIAPFTQPCFIPKQFGYFNADPAPIGTANIDWVSNDQRATYESTIVKFMENLVQEITFAIPAPVNNAFQNLRIEEIEILYKDSEEQSIKSVDVLKGSDIEINGFAKYVFYKYESNKPYKVLPTSATTRVYDQVPVRALTQEVAGNRVMYGNYIDRQPWPSSIEYRVAVDDKWQPTTISSQVFAENASLEYPNHSVKQNRNYQVGIVLSDRYGRQSPVILSSNTRPDQQETGFGGDTIFVPYRNDLNVQGPSYDEAVWKWPGYSIKVLFDNLIDVGNVGLWSNENPLGWYSYKIVVKQQEQDYYNCYLPGVLNGYPSKQFQDSQEINNLGFSVLINDNINKIPRRLNEVGPNQKLYGSSIKLYGRVTNWWENFEAPDQDEFPGINYTRQFNIRESLSDTAVTIGSRDDMDLESGNFENPLPEYLLDANDLAIFPFYQATTNPLFVNVELSNELQNPYILNPPIDTMGVVGFPLIQDPTGALDADRWTAFVPQLSIYETSPTTSNLDIYWETTSSGLLDELNEAIATGDLTLPFEVEDFNFDLSEDTTQLPSGNWVTDWFYFKNFVGTPLNNINSIQSLVVTDLNGTVLNSLFQLVWDPTYQVIPGVFGAARIKVVPANMFVYLEDLNIRNYKISFDVINSNSISTNFTLDGALRNIAPRFTLFDTTPNPGLAQTINFQGDYTGPWAIRAVNGHQNIAGGNVNDKSELVFEIVSQSDNTGTPINNFELINFQNNSISFVDLAVDPNNLLLPGQYIIEIRVTDANGVGLSADIAISAIVTEPAVNDDFFTGSATSHTETFSNSFFPALPTDDKDANMTMVGLCLFIGDPNSYNIFGNMPDMRALRSKSYNSFEKQGLELTWSDPLFSLTPGATATYYSSGNAFASSTLNSIVELDQISSPLQNVYNDDSRNKWVVPVTIPQNPFEDTYTPANTMITGRINLISNVWEKENVNSRSPGKWKVDRQNRATGDGDLHVGTVLFTVKFSMSLHDWRRTWDNVGAVTAFVNPLWANYTQAPELYWYMKSAVTIETRTFDASISDYTAWAPANDINETSASDIFKGSFQSAPTARDTSTEEYDKDKDETVNYSTTIDSSIADIILTYTAPSPTQADDQSNNSNQDVEGGTVEGSFNMAVKSESEGVQFRVFVGNMGAFNTFSPTGEIVEFGASGLGNGQNWVYRGSTRTDKPQYGQPGRMKALLGGNGFKNNGHTIIARKYNTSATANNNSQVIFSQAPTFTVHAEDLFYRPGNTEIYYKYRLAPFAFTSREDAAGDRDNNGANPRAANGIDVFARVGPMRYVKEFYTRTGTPGNYIYELWFPAGQPQGDFYYSYSNNEDTAVDESNSCTREDTEYAWTWDGSSPSATNNERIWTAKINSFGEITENKPKVVWP